MAAETYFVPISKRGVMSLPAALRRRFKLDTPGAQVEVQVDEEAQEIRLRPHIAIPVDQAWFWTPEWQAKEREADEAIARGDTTFFASDEEFMAWLEAN
jgi:hypothetical protein